VGLQRDVHLALRRAPVQHAVPGDVEPREPGRQPLDLHGVAPAVQLPLDVHGGRDALAVLVLERPRRRHAQAVAVERSFALEAPRRAAECRAPAPPPRVEDAVAVPLHVGVAEIQAVEADLGIRGGGAGRAGIHGDRAAVRRALA
jgi:hypothetical protein